MNIREIVGKIKSSKEDGIKEVFLVACGGSLVDMYSSQYFLQSEARELRVLSYTSNEFVHATPKSLGKNSVVIACSHGGNTPETVEAAKVAREKGAATITLTHNKDADLIKYADYNILYEWGNDTSVEDNPMAIILNIAVEILNQTEVYEGYNKFMEGLKIVNDVVKRGQGLVAERAKKYAEKYKDEPITYVLGSGASYGHAYGFSICSLMEMQWMNASAVHSGEYFHGPFEVTDKETLYLLLMNEGRTRELDERALKFLNKYGAKVEVVDCKELGISVIDSSVVEFFNPIVFYSILCVYREELAKLRNHDLDTRRYMGKVEY
ncbi:MULTISPECIES: SIS domain-containing protein [Clostridium]|uniref:Fructoselysine-6-P-deglycase FrlB-like protein n=1 Tax=Clostridium beijerinckii TaxID=1520 RepID=A0AAE5EX70_CLOBE|nr:MULTISPECIES: SIS domain-containing protein [Clostridium]NSB12384.1 fructoselysine-6-P-deglycase FrlB-like protein [Clostridium beijerinckii]OOM31165.1 fructosamine deglycase FrlB [Clostridium beijerinckii]